MNVSDAIRSKRAIRKFKDEALPEDVVKAILNAGRRSQSSKNEQGCPFMAMEPGRHVYKERKPFVMKADTYIKARQFEIEFKHGGFTVEVVKVDGQG